MEKIQPPEKPSPLPGVYEHYKSTAENKKHYRVYGIGKAVETGEKLVLYQTIDEVLDDIGSESFDTGQADVPASLDVQFFLAMHTETGDVVVVEASQCDIPVSEKLSFARPVDMFVGSVEVEGETVPRFRYGGPGH